MKDDTKTKPKLTKTPDSELQAAVINYFRAVAFRAADKKKTGAMPPVIVVRHFGQFEATKLSGAVIAIHPNMAPMLCRSGGKRVVLVGAVHARAVWEKTLLYIGR